jgi:hypothetical protein
MAVESPTPEPETAQPDLAQRVARLEALAEIRQLYVDYGRHLDAGDLAAYVELFAQNAKLRLGPVMRADGRAAIETVAARVLRGNGEHRTVHLLGSPRIELDGERASGECVWMAVGPHPSGTPLIRVGRHVDELVREGGRWRFAKRVGLIDVGSVGQAADASSAQQVSTKSE